MMSLFASYTLDRETIKLNTYRLLCLFYANKEISRLSDPTKRDDAASKLAATYFAHEVSHLLLDIAVALRVLDDQILSLPSESIDRQRYLKSRDEVNRGFHCMMFDELPLREVCNKIIHAIVVEPHFQEGRESHELDDCNWIGWEHVATQSKEIVPEPEPVKWQHLNAFVRLGGRKGKEEWWHLLEVPTFVDAIYYLFETESP